MASDWAKALYDAADAEKAKKAAKTAQRNGTPPESVNRSTGEIGDARIRAYIDKAFREEIALVAATTKGQRNEQLFKSAANLGELIATGLDEAIVRGALFDAAVACGLVADDGANAALATIESGVERGKANPRDIPPPKDDATIHTLNGDSDGDAETEDAEQTRLEQLRGLILDSDGLDTIPDPEPLIHNWLYLDALGWLTGKPGDGKTFLALTWAACVATGTNWEGHPVAQGPVLYVVAEGARGIRRRIRAWEESNGSKAIGLHFLPVPVQMLSATDLSAVRTIAAELGVTLVVLDTQARVAVGADENSSKDMGQFIAAVDTLRTVTGAAVLLVHHEPRTGENPRGSSAIDGAAVTIARVSKDGAWVRLTSTKDKDDETPPPVHLRLVPTGESAVFMSHDGVGPADDLADSQKTLLAVLWDSFGTTGAKPGELLEASGLAKTTYHRARNALLTRGAIRNEGTDKRPLYFPSAGQELL